MEDNIICVEGLKKQYRINKRANGIFGHIANLFVPKYEKKIAVDDISFHIKEGEMVGFIGANGAGKSTTIKMLSGILYPDGGKISVDGFNPYKDRKKYVANIGVVFGQKSQLAWDLPVIDSYELLKHIYKIPKNVYQENLKWYTELLDMKDFIEQPVRQLSLGQRMRADIAAALLHSPKIIFFDEPTIGLDVLAKEKIRNFIRQLNKEKNITMIFTTHDMQDIEKTCNRLIVIDKGKKIYDGSVSGLLMQYGSKRKMIVEFNGQAPIDLNWENVQISSDKDSPHKLTLQFDNNVWNAKDIFEMLTREYAVKDLSIIDMDVEGVVRNIYEGSIVFE